MAILCLRIAAYIPIQPTNRRSLQQHVRVKTGGAFPYQLRGWRSGGARLPGTRLLGDVRVCQAFVADRYLSGLA